MSSRDARPSLPNANLESGRIPRSNPPPSNPSTVHISRRRCGPATPEPGFGNLTSTVRALKWTALHLSVMHVSGLWFSQVSDFTVLPYLSVMHRACLKRSVFPDCRPYLARGARQSLEDSPASSHTSCCVGPCLTRRPIRSSEGFGPKRSPIDSFPCPHRDSHLSVTHDSHLRIP